MLENTVTSAVFTDSVAHLAAAADCINLFVVPSSSAHPAVVRP